MTLREIIAQAIWNTHRNIAPEWNNTSDSARAWVLAEADNVIIDVSAAGWELPAGDQDLPVAEFERRRPDERDTQRMLREMMMTLEDLKTKVTNETQVEQAGIVLMQGLSQQLKDALAANDPAAVQALADQLDANAAAMSQAITANTPAATP